MRLWPAAVCVIVPLALGIAWQLHTPPPDVACFAVATEAIEGSRGAWLEGAGIAFGVGALAVLAAIVQVSVRRMGARRPGAATLAIAGRASARYERRAGRFVHPCHAHVAPAPGMSQPATSSIAKVRFVIAAASLSCSAAGCAGGSSSRARNSSPSDG